MMYGYGFPGMWVGGIVMMLFWVIVLVAVVWGIVVFTRNAGRSNQPGPHGEAPLDILKRRYAAGEINKEQYDEMKRTLGA